MSEPWRDLEGENFGHTVMQYKRWKSHGQAGHVGGGGTERRQGASRGVVSEGLGGHCEGRGCGLNPGEG